MGVWEVCSFLLTTYILENKAYLFHFLVILFFLGFLVKSLILRNVLLLIQETFVRTSI